VSPASDESTGPASQSSSNSPSSDESDPFTWDLAFFGRCEGFDVDNSLLKSLPVRDKLNAEWAYKNGGATDNSVITLTIPGNSDAAVVLKGIHIVDLERSPAPSDISAVYPCEVSGGHLDRRYYELVLDEHPRLTARPGWDVDDTITEPVKDFPFKVSDSDPEYFEFDIAPGPACLCSWKIALDWTSSGRSGRQATLRWMLIRLITSVHIVPRVPRRLQCSVARICARTAAGTVSPLCCT